MSRKLSVVVLLVAVGLTACSGDQGSGDDAEKTSPAPATDSRTAPRDLPEVPQLRQAAGAVSDLELGDCEVEPGQQQVSGTITSSRKRPGDYVVVVSWTNDHADVRGRAVVVEEDVEPGETREWETTAGVASGATRCVPNVRVGELKG